MATTEVKLIFKEGKGWVFQKQVNGHSTQMYVDEMGNLTTGLSGARAHTMQSGAEQWFKTVQNRERYNWFNDPDRPSEAPVSTEGKENAA